MALVSARFGSLPAGLSAAGLVVLTFASPLAGQKPAAVAAPTPRAARAAVRPAPGGLRAGIRVHGRWTIVVRNKDGSIAAKREFENTLQLDGADALPLLLGGFATPGAWALYAGDSVAGGGPCTTGGITVFGTSGAGTAVYDPCVSVEGAGQYYVSGGPGQGCAGLNSTLDCSPDLKTGVVGSATATGGKTLYGLQLQGALAVTAGGSLDTVGTFLVVCPTQAGAYTARATSTPAACDATPSTTNAGPAPSGTYQWQFTATPVPGGPISTVPGQTVQVTVVISFS